MYIPYIIDDCDSCCIVLYIFFFFNKRVDSDTSENPLQIPDD